MSLQITRRNLVSAAAFSAVALAARPESRRALTSWEEPPDPPLIPLPRMQVGAFCGYRNYPNDPAEPKAECRSRVTALLGGSLPVERNYFPYDAPVQSAVPSISTWAFPPGELVAGVHDAEITETILATPAIRWTCNDHEPDQAGRGYSASEYVAGARHFYDVVKAADPTVQVGTILMQWSVVFGGLDWRDWYPGDDYTDYLGWDIYFEPWQGAGYPPAAMFEPILAINASIEKPMVIGELGIGPRRASHGVFSDSEKAAILTDSLDLLGDASLGVPVSALTYFYTNKAVADWTLDAWPETRDVLAKAVAACTLRTSSVVAGRYGHGA
jgi:glycosyl hydrolase family 26